MKCLYIIGARYDLKFHATYVAPALSAGHEVEVWETMDIFTPVSAKKYRPDAPAGACPWKSFARLESLSRAIGQVGKDVLVINLLHYDKCTHAFYKACKKFDGVMISFHPKNCPLPEDSLRNMYSRDFSLRALRKNFGSLNKIKKTVALSSSSPAELVGVRSVNALVVNSVRPRKSCYPIGPKTRMIMVPSMDYDEFVRWRRSGSPGSGIVPDGRPLVAYIDSFSPRHPDYLRRPGHRRPITEEGLYPHVRKLLEKFKNLGMRVVVAAHPRAQREGWLEYYDGFELVQGKTLPLTSEADLVVNMYSTAISFAALLGKAILTVTTDEFETYRLGGIIRHYAELFGTRLINISGEYDLDPGMDMKVDAERYRRFLEEYVVPPGVNMELTFWEQLLPQLEGLLTDG